MPHTTSGFAKSLGDGATIPFATQTNLAIEYLGRHQEELKRLANFEGATIRNLMLHYFVPDVPGLCGDPVDIDSQLAYHSLVTAITVTYLIDLKNHCP